MGLTLEKVAKLSNSCKSYIWELENNDKLEPSASKLHAIARALSTTSDFLLTGISIGCQEQYLLNNFSALTPHNKLNLLDISKTLFTNQSKIAQITIDELREYHTCAVGLPIYTASDEDSKTHVWPQPYTKQEVRDAD